MDKILKLNNINKRYYSKKECFEAIKDISLDIYEKEYIVIVGPSGCGKSTLLDIILGLEDKTFGNIEINKNIKIGYMLQSDALFPWLTILDNCLLGLKINKELTEDNIKYVKELLNKYGLSEFINNYPSSLSGGMRQRVALIRTLAIKPDILLLDEPFSALDYQTRLKVSDDVYKIIKDTGKTAIMITHDIAEAVSMGDRVIVLTKCPSEVKSIYEINYEDRENPMENRKKKEFNYYYEMIWNEIDKNE